MPRRLTSVAAAPLVVLAFAALPASAQMVASRDLTSGWRVPSGNIAVPQTFANTRSSGIDDDYARNSAVKVKDIEMTIVQTLPAHVGLGNEFYTSVRPNNIWTPT